MRMQDHIPRQLRKLTLRNVKNKKIMFLYILLLLFFFIWSFCFPLFSFFFFLIIFFCASVFARNNRLFLPWWKYNYYFFFVNKINKKQQKKVYRFETLTITRESSTADSIVLIWSEPKRHDDIEQNLEFRVEMKIGGYLLGEWHLVYIGKKKKRK